MRVINAFQLVGLFVSGPFAINWLWTAATFPCAELAAVVATAIYVVSWFFAIAAAYALMEKME